MKKIRHFMIPALVSGIVIPAAAITLDWDKIEFWTGEGTSRSALIVQFQDNGPKEAYVWGFRWNPEDYEGGQPSGEDMFRALATANPDLTLFTQFTGSMGSTVDGIGFNFAGCGNVLDNIAYNFEGASSDPRVSFDYYTPNTLMGQTSAPGMFTPVYCSEAIEEAITTGILEHPINAREYGYPAYDYDWWQSTAPLDNNRQRWNAGWYDGYWSYWVGDTDLEELSYSGLGMTSRKLSDGQIDAWKYTLLDGPVTGLPAKVEAQNRTPRRIDGNTGASEQWYALSYSHAAPQSGVSDIRSDADSSVEIYTLQGVKVAATSIDRFNETADRLPKGCYVVKAGRKTTKLVK